MLFQKGVCRKLAKSSLSQASETPDNLHQENRFHSKKEEAVWPKWIRFGNSGLQDESRAIIT